LKLLLVAYSGPEHIGCFFLESARDLGFDVAIHDMGLANSRPGLAERIRYRLFDKKPRFIQNYSASVLSLCKETKPDFVLATGFAPLLGTDLKKIRQLGIKTANFSTDDPWNRVHRSSWFFSSLKEYDLVCTPRRHSIPEFVKLGIADVRYLAFAYHPRTHFFAGKDLIQDKFKCDVLFYGGADDERAAFFSKFIESGLDLHLYGGYWSRYPKLRRFYKGMLLPQDIPAAVIAAKLTICIGRKSNRDSHAMRTYEAAAMGACMLVEETEDHRKLFGDDDNVVSFFSSSDQIIARSVELISDPAKRNMMRKNVYDRVTSSANTYADRLESIVKFLFSH
jgi:spore maturation protein CgeB